jgi:hypothetical protein
MTLLCWAVVMCGVTLYVTLGGGGDGFCARRALVEVIAASAAAAVVFQEGDDYLWWLSSWQGGKIWQGQGKSCSLQR